MTARSSQSEQDLAAGLADVRAWATTAARAAASKGGDDTIVLEVGQILAITEAFVITSGTNHRQVRTIAEEIEAQVKVGGGPSPLRLEGVQQAEWILLDYGDFVAHVFLDETREYYDLERLWADAPRIEWDDGAPARDTAALAQP
jgi:ribosome-associated protein